MANTMGIHVLIAGSTVLLLTLYFIYSIYINQFSTTTTFLKQINGNSSTTDYKPLTANYQEIPSANLSGVKINNSVGENIVNGASTSHLYEGGYDIPYMKLCPNLGASLKILVLIPSAPNNADARMAIRHTWGQYAQQKGIAYSFVLARANTPELTSAISLESDLFSDIIGCKFLDVYNNLTLKTMCMMEWAHNYCPKVKFILKTNDNMFINIPKLLSFVQQRSEYRRTIFGMLHTKTAPIRTPSNKWFVSKQEYAPDIYPDYADGDAYLLTSDIAHDLYVTALNTTFLKIEDAFITGIVAQAINIERINENKFLIGTPHSSEAFTKRYFEEYLSIRVAKYHEQYSLSKIIHGNITTNYKPLPAIAFPAANLKGVKINNSVQTKIVNSVLTSQLYDGGYDIPNEKLCPNLGASLKILVLIPSAPNNAENRMAIRHTWGQYAQQTGIRIGFVLAQVETELASAIRLESDLYSDIIGCRFLDSYNNLTLKNTCMMQWIDIYCRKVKFILKADDDMFINIPKLISFIEQRSDYTRTIFGALHINTRPLRDKAYKWYVSKEEYPSDIYPDYAVGASYLLTGDIAHDLYVTALNTAFFRMDDVFMTGIVAQAINVERTNVDKFLIWTPRSSKSFTKSYFEDYLSILVANINEQFILWKIFN